MRPLPEFDRDLAARMYAAGATIQEIADAQPGWRRDKMRVRLIAEGIHEAGHVRPTTKARCQGHTTQDYIAAFEAGRSDEQIAEEFGVGIERISRMRYLLGYREKISGGGGHTREDYERRFDAGWNDAQIAEEFGVSVGHVSRTRLKLGYREKMPLHRPSPSINDEEVRRLTLEAGLSASEIAVRLQTTKRTVERSRKRLRIRLAEPAGVGLAPLEERLVRAGAMLDDGCPFAEITRTLHIHPRVLRREFPGRQWTDRQVQEHRIAVMVGARNIRQAWPNA